MQKEVQIISTGNAGVLIKFNNCTLLIDGIYNCRGLPFYDISQKHWENMLSCCCPFEKIDYMLFTHNHPDHIDAERLLVYLQKHRIKGLIIPEASCRDNTELKEYLGKNNIPTILLSEKTNGAEISLESEIVIHSYVTGHIGEEFGDMIHSTYLIECREKRLLFTSDADYTKETFCFIPERIDAAFINPLFLHAVVTGRFFKGSLNADRIIVYHIPPEENDSYGMRKQVEKDICRAVNTKITAFYEPFNEIRL